MKLTCPSFIVSALFVLGCGGASKQNANQSGVDPNPSTSEINEENTPQLPVAVMMRVPVKSDGTEVTSEVEFRTDSSTEPLTDEKGIINAWDAAKPESIAKDETDGKTITDGWFLRRGGHHHRGHVNHRGHRNRGHVNHNGHRTRARYWWGHHGGWGHGGWGGGYGYRYAPTYGYYGRPYYYNPYPYYYGHGGYNYYYYPRRHW